MNKFIEITISPDGNIEVDKQGFEGQSCSGKADDIIKSLGKLVRTTRKSEYYTNTNVQINQKY